MTCAPALTTASTSSPSRAKSAERMEGAIHGVCMGSVYAERADPGEPGCCCSGEGYGFGTERPGCRASAVHTCANTEQLRTSLRSQLLRRQSAQRLEVVCARLLDDLPGQGRP